ncbi:hypothetical protein AXK58_19325 [Tsukamurella tyrosinosolvens]|uniref:Uncharacterized protein n=1 Tax=Tsukamurella tyrosinosolvens TaxID=57704 RepID=A0A1H4I657_TSUTY|nr:hypothetical protein AXK58_19325 [Tsukamurella tyrosinosolvens]SEB29411.1 hypothetical protein SAMN04489793_0018 [Tsukamurella tyrosinosolvens]
MASPSDPPTDRAGDTAQFPVTRVSTAAATDTDDVPSTGGPAHAVTAGTPGISRAGWWAITIAAAVLLVLGFLLTFGPARYWTPVPVVFLGYFLLSGVIGLVFWKGVRELRDSNPTLHSGDGPATPGARVAAAIGAVGVASALVLLPAGLSDAPANAAPCPDGSNTCGPQPTMGPQPTQGNGGNTTAPQAPNTTVPGYTPPDTPPQQGNGSTPTVQGQVPTMPTGDSPSNGCIFNCGPTQAPQAPQTGQATPPQTGQNPATTAPNTPATTPQAPTTTPRLRTPTPETTTSTTSSKARDRDDEQQRSSDEDREKNSGIPYQAAEIAALAGTYRRKKLTETATAVNRAERVVLRSGPAKTWSPSDIIPDSSYGFTLVADPEDKARAASLAKVWDAMQNNFNSVFPIGGAPKKMPAVGDVLNLTRAGAPFPVKVKQIEFTGSNINILYEAMPGHVDGAGSTIRFNMFKEAGDSGRLMLRVDAHVKGGVGGAVNTNPGGYASTYLIARDTWQQFVDQAAAAAAGA